MGHVWPDQELADAELASDNIGLPAQETSERELLALAKGNGLSEAMRFSNMGGWNHRRDQIRLTARPTE